MATKKNEKNWYLLVKGKESGPFDYIQVKKKINTGEVSSFDNIKALNQENWGTLLDHEIFNKEAILAEIKTFKTMADDNTEGNRQHKRAPILADVFVKRNGVLLKGRAVEVGKGGMGIEAGVEFSGVDDVISLYCSPVSESIAFNCHAKIVSKIKKNQNTYKYGTQFLKVSRKGEVFLYKMLQIVENLKVAS